MKRPDFAFGALYAAAALVLIDQGSELLAGLAPYRWSDVEWRFGAFGLAMARATALVLGDALILVAGTARDDRRLLRTVAVLHLLLAGVILAALGLTGLDFLELRSRVRSEATLRVVTVAAVRAGVIGVLTAGYAVALGLGLLGATRQRPRKDGVGENLLVTGLTRPS